MTRNMAGVRRSTVQRPLEGFALCLLLAALGCGQEPTVPSTPAAQPEQLASTSASTLLFRQMSAGGQHTCGVTMDNLAYCWGFNASGQIGDGSDAEERTFPTAVAGGHLFSEVAVGIDHSCGVTLEKKVYCWGDNGDGELGDGTLGDRSTPVLVVGGRSFTTVEAGSRHTCAIEDGTNRAFCWGRNRGALGNGESADSPRPVLVSGGFHWLQVSAGNGLTCGVTTLHRAYCWGQNGNGQLGDGSTLIRLQPSPVLGGIHFAQVTAGGFHSCGVTTSGGVFCWGYGGVGQLGIGTTTNAQLTPKRIASRNDWAEVSAAYEHTCALTTSQRAWCWGNNGQGRLGDNGTTTRLKPVLVGGGMAFRQVTAGMQHSCGVSRLRPGYCWGENNIGQVGVSPHGEYHTPTQVHDPIQ